MRKENFKKTKLPGLFRTTDGTGRWYVRAAVRVDGQIVAIKKLLPAVNPATGQAYTEVEAFAAFTNLKELAKVGNRLPESTPTPHPLDMSQTVEQYIVRWLAIKGPRLSPSTAEGYEDAINNRILPRLGWMQCRDVTRQAIEAWVVWVEAQVKPATLTMVKDGKEVTYNNPKAGEPYRQDTMRKWWRCLKTILGDMAADLKDLNAAIRVRQPERPELPGVREQRTLDADVTGTLLAIAKKRYPQHFACIAVMAMTGMRAGEVFGLQWDVVDFAAGTITVRRAISRGKLRPRTKTGSWRNVPMHEELAAILQAHRQEQIAMQHPGLSTGLLFPSDEGNARIPSSIRKVWATLAELTKTDIRIGNQVLRRSLNTQLVLAGVDRITTRAILGHTSEAMTQLYAGIGMAAKKDAVAKIKPKLKAVEDDGQ